MTRFEPPILDNATVLEQRQDGAQSSAIPESYRFWTTDLISAFDELKRRRVLSYLTTSNQKCVRSRSTQVGLWSSPLGSCTSPVGGLGCSPIIPSYRYYETNPRLPLADLAA